MEFTERKSQKFARNDDVSGDFRAAEMSEVGDTAALTIITCPAIAGGAVNPLKD
jgi:hypothetical protein